MPSALQLQRSSRLDSIAGKGPHHQGSGRIMALIEALQAKRREAHDRQAALRAEALILVVH